MAASALIPRNGAVAYGNLVINFNSFRWRGQQSVEVITPYGTGITCSQNIGSGTPDFTADITGFMLAHSTNAQPFMGGSTSSLYYAAAGQTAVLTFDTGCTETFTGIVQDFQVSHARMRGAVPASMTLKNAGEVQEAWATT